MSTMFLRSHSFIYSSFFLAVTLFGQESASPTNFKEHTLCSTASLEVKTLPKKGRGVFAKRSFKKGEVIERAPVIVLSATEEPTDKSLTLYNYVFGWGKDCQYSALALGFGSLYNHSYSPNAYYVPREEMLCIDFVAYKAIEEGEEITVNYNRDPESQKPVWFETP